MSDRTLYKLLSLPPLSGYTPAIKPTGPAANNQSSVDMKQGWCDLPSDLLYEIDAELAYIEKVRIRATCVWWYSILSKMPNHKLPQLPWLLQTNVDTQGTKSYALYNLYDKISYRLELPQLQGKFLKGSAHGWLVTISVDQNETTPSPTSPDICLLNPLTGVQVQLPPRSTFPDVEKYYPDRVGLEYCLIERKDDLYDIGSNHVNLNLIQLVVTSSSCYENCVVAALYTGVRKVAWCMYGHEKWTALDLYPDTNLRPSAILDLLFSDNRLYVLNCLGCLFQVEFSGDSDPKVTVLVGQELPRERIGDHMFVVEGSDKRLRMVVRTFNDTFEVHELDLEESCWVYTNNTGNDMVFLGYNQSLSVPACQFPGYTENRIYFADDDDLYEHSAGKEDALIGVYNFEEGRMEKFADFPNVSRSLLPQPIWIRPPTYC